MVLFVSVAVILMCVLLMYNNFSKNKNLLYLGGSLIFICIIAILHYFTIIVPNRLWTAILTGHFIPVSYLIGPFMYFYSRNSLKGFIKFNKIDCLHFLPFIISLISIFPYYFTDFDSKLRIAQLIIDKPNYLSKASFSWLYPNYINLFLRPTSFFSYCVISIIMLVQFYKKKKDLKLNKKRKLINFKWLVTINIILLLVAICYTQLTINFLIIKENSTRIQINNSLINFSVGILFLLIPILILVFPELLYGNEKIKTNTSQKKLSLRNDHESLTNTAALILDFVKKEENLLNPDFAIADICNALNLKSKDVLYCFNVILEIKFTTLRKKLRIDIAKKELENGKLLSNSMEGIWMKSGFSSRTSFFVAFKEVSGMTPLEYLKTLEKEAL